MPCGSGRSRQYVRFKAGSSCLTKSSCMLYGPEVQRMSSTGLCWGPQSIALSNAGRHVHAKG